MATLISKQKTRLGPRVGGVRLKPGVRVTVDDEKLDELLAWGKGGGRRLERAGLLLVIRKGEELPPPPAPGLEGEAAGSDPLADGIPDTLADLTVRKAKPIIDAAEDLELVLRWAEAESEGEARAGILEPLKRRYLELGGEVGDDGADGDEGDDGGGDEG